MIVKDSSLGAILSGAGKVLVGVAAVIGACAAKEAVTKISINNSVNNSVQVNLPQACQQFEQLKQADGDQSALSNTIQNLPEIPTKGGSGLIIREKYRDELRRDLGTSPADQKGAIIQKYYEKSLSDLGLKSEPGKANE